MHVKLLKCASNQINFAHVRDIQTLLNLFSLIIHDNTQWQWIRRCCSESYGDSVQCADMEENSLLRDILSLRQLGHTTWGTRVPQFTVGTRCSGQSILCSQRGTHCSLHKTTILPPYCLLLLALPAVVIWQVLSF